MRDLRGDQVRHRVALPRQGNGAGIAQREAGRHGEESADRYSMAAGLQTTHCTMILTIASIASASSIISNSA